MARRKGEASRSQADGEEVNPGVVQFRREVTRADERLNAGAGTIYHHSLQMVDDLTVLRDAQSGAESGTDCQ